MRTKTQSKLNKTIKSDPKGSNASSKKTKPSSS